MGSLAAAQKYFCSPFVFTFLPQFFEKNIYPTDQKIETKASKKQNDFEGLCSAIDEFLSFFILNFYLFLSEESNEEQKPAEFEIK